jgi:phage shock protein PspC (stress-responsive transcriptional regulator)
MQKVIAINLNGNAYQIDEGGYAALVAYLEGAQRQLKDNPDRAEVLADLEQAIADKCNAFLGPHKTVVTSLEVDQVIKAMGPVDGAATQPAGEGRQEAKSEPGGQSTAGAGAPKRLYQIPEGAMLSGVCNGLAAYLNIDVTIIRLIFLALLFVTGGGFALAYIVLACVIPSAYTSEERAAAHGQRFSAQELIDRAKKDYARFKDGRELRREQRREHRQWKAQWRQRRWGMAGGPPQAAGYGYGTQLVAGFMVPILSLLSAAFFWIWVYAIVSLVTRSEVFGQPLPDEMPLWGGLLILVFVYQAIAWPLHAARRASYDALGSPRFGMVAALDGMISVGFVVLVIWLGYQYVPGVREVIQSLPDVWESLRQGSQM